MSSGRIDHVTIGVADLDAGIAAYRRIGFEARREGDRGVACNEGDFLELRKRGREGLELIAVEGKGSAAAFLAFVRPRAPGEAGRHPNGVVRLDRAYIVVADLASAVETYRRALGIAPKMERGTVINADMAVFQLGAAALTLAHPTAPGVAADALARRGPGPFQLLYRTSSMDAAARWITDHGLPPPARGIRHTGEQAMLVPPEHACGVYIGFVGPA